MLKNLILWMLVALSGVFCVLTARNYFQGSNSDDLFRYGKDLPEVLYLVEQAYVDKVDMKQLMPGAFQGTLDAVDENASYLPAGSQLKINTTVCYQKTGLAIFKQNGYPYIMAVAENSPADRVGFKPSMYIRRIGGISARTLSLFQIEEQLSKAKKLEVLALGIGDVDDQTFSLSATSFDEPPLSVSTPAPQISLIKLNHYYSDLGKDLDRALAALPKGNKLVLDLRNNALSPEPFVTLMASRFLKQGVLASWVDAKDQTRQIVNAVAAPSRDQELFILVDHTTSQAAEIFAAVAQNQKSARLVGEQTLGLPSFYEDLPLKNKAYLRLSTHKLVFGDQIKLTNKGLKPNLKVATKEMDTYSAENLLKAALDLVKKGIDTPIEPEEPSETPEPVSAKPLEAP